MGYAERIAAANTQVVSTPGIMGGLPCISGTRVLAETIRQYLIHGDSKRTIYEDYPYLPPGAVEAVIRWCEETGLECSAS